MAVPAWLRRAGVLRLLLRLRSRRRVVLLLLLVVRGQRVLLHDAKVVVSIHALRRRRLRHAVA